jgi:hypothetical protein
MPNSLITSIGPVGRWLLPASIVLASTGIGQAPRASVVSSTPPPAPPPVVGGLTSVAALSPSYVWAVGGAFTERWNGRHWTSVPNPTTAAAAGVEAELSGVAVASADDAWAVGYYGGGCCGLFAHWNGTSWRRRPG